MKYDVANYPIVDLAQELLIAALEEVAHGVVP